jgi:hypothetical protein
VKSVVPINSADVPRYLLTPKPAVNPFNLPTVSDPNPLNFIPPMNSTAYLDWALLAKVPKNKNKTMHDNVFKFNLHPVLTEPAGNRPRSQLQLTKNPS